jgi:uncharacterized membrane protein YczE
VRFVTKGVIKGVFKFHWMGWKRFAYDFFIIQIGFLLFGMSIDIMVQADLGLDPWDVLHMALTHHLPITLGEASIGVAFIVVIVDVVLGEPLGWGTIMNMIFIGVWVDALRPFVPTVPSVFWAQVAYLLLGTLVMGFGTAIYVGVDAGAGPRDSLMLALSRIGKTNLRWSRTLLESATVVIGWLLGGPLWVGTILFAVTIGPAVQLAFRVLKVKSSRPGLDESKTCTTEARLRCIP